MTFGLDYRTWPLVAACLGRAQDMSVIANPQHTSAHWQSSDLPELPGQTEAILSPISVSRLLSIWTLDAMND
jgi:hypothetical protein